MILRDDELAIFELAFHLKKTVGELINTMDYEEFLKWLQYLERRPPGWQEDDRTYKLLQAQGVKEKAWVLFPSLKAVYFQKKDGFDVKGFKSSFLFQKILSAKKGDKLNYD